LDITRQILACIVCDLVVQLAGVPDRLFKRHGHWKSENAKDGYIDDAVERRLFVTRQLGL